MNADVEKAVEYMRALVRFGNSVTRDHFECLEKALRDKDAEIARLRARSEKDAAMLRKCRQFVAWATERLPEAVPVYDELNAHLGGENV